MEEKTMSYREAKLYNQISTESEQESDDDHDMNHQQSVSIDSKLKDIEKKSKQKYKIRNIKNCGDLFKWYWQNPIAHLPILYFFLCFLSSFLFAIYWFMNENTSYIICGIIGLLMTGYAIRKFKISMALKYQIDKYKSLNLRFKKENKKLKLHVARVVNAKQHLKKTRRRLIIANNANKDNIKKFEQIEENMKIAGEQQIVGMASLHKTAIGIRQKWRDEFLSNEREMLHAVYNRYERKHTNKSNLGMSPDDFQQFQQMLPRRYASRFDRMGTFHALAGDDSMMAFDQFSNVLDEFAKMEVDQKDIDVTPRHSRKKAHASIQQVVNDEITPESLNIPQYK